MKNLTKFRLSVTKHLFGGNQATAMQMPDNKEGSDSRSDVWRNFRRIPDVSSFKITARLVDQLLAKFDLVRRTGGLVEITRYRNRDINRYLEHQFIRMSRADEVTFWRIACALMRRSRCFFVLSLNHVYPRWYKTLPWESIVRLYKTFLRRVRFEWIDADFISSVTEIRMARVYIEKSENKWRPLGVPSPSWRIYLHMWSSLLMWRYDGRLSDCQHGFRPGRGTGTAWQRIVQILGCRNIYEYDLVSFFDNVNLLSVGEVLRGFGCPPSIVNYLVELNRCANPKLQSTDLTDESLTRVKRAYLDDEGIWGRSSNPWADDPRVTSRPDGIVEPNLDAYQGVAQGSATGPFLASLALENSMFTRGVGCVQYADDGLFFSDSSFDPTLPAEGEEVEPGWEDTDPWRGIVLHPEKSGWVKKDGVWLKPLKFLGLVYDGLSDVLYSDTKTGKRLIFDKDRLLDELREADLGPTVQSAPSSSSSNRFEAMILSRFWGFVQSRLYNGSWNCAEAFQNFHFISSSKSWVRRMRLVGSRSVLPVSLYNASSVSCRSLLAFLRTLDTVKRGERWSRRPVVAEAPLRDVDRGSSASEPISWVMKKEWLAAYARPTYDAFEAWMVYYVGRMFPHSVYTEEQMYVHYSVMYFSRRVDKLDGRLRDASNVRVFMKAKLVSRDEARLRGENIQYPWADYLHLRREVELLRSEQDRLISEMGAFQQRVRQHLASGRVYKAKLTNTPEDYSKLVIPRGV